MTPKLDRTEISRMMLPHFPSMSATATSEDWHGFLDAATGLTTPMDMPNGEAFDRWRQALAAQGYPTWNYTPEQTTAMAARAEQLKQAEALRMSELPELLARLKKEAPLVTAAELLKKP